MTLGGKVHHSVRPIALEHLAHRRGVRDVGAHEGVAGIVRDGRERIQIARIGELVDDHHVIVGLADDVAHDRRSDEAGTACDENAPRH